MSQSSENVNVNDSVPSSSPWYEKVTATAKGYIGFESSSFGATLALPVALINAVTTIQGAGKVLPAGLGGPVGSLLSAIYFLIVISDKAKKIHPLRRLLLISILSSSSAYCSFFSIYEAMSGVSLEKKASEPSLKAHNKFVASTTQSIEGLKSRIRKKMPPQYIEIIQIEKEMDSQREEIDRQKKLNNLSRAEELNTSLQRNKERKESLKPLPNSPEHQQGEINYSLYKNLIDFSKSNRGQSPEQSSISYADSDRVAYKEIVELIKSSGDEEFYKSFLSNLYEPKRDDYSNTPLFLIPFEIAQSNDSKRERDFLLCSALIALMLEIAPLLLSGITFRSSNYYFNISGSRMKYPKDATSKISAHGLNHAEEPTLSSRHSDDERTPMSQISAFACFLIDEFCQMTREVSEVLSSFKKFKLTNNMRNRLYSQFNQSMQAADLNDPIDQYYFMVFFYESIDHNSKEISLSSFTTGDKVSISDFTEEQGKLRSLRYKVAAGLLVDLMSSKQIRWLKKSDTKNAPNLNVLRNPPTIMSKERINFSEGSQYFTTWRFQDECYQEFLDWWLVAHYPQSAKQIESINAFLKLMVYYQLRLGLVS